MRATTQAPGGRRVVIVASAGLWLGFLVLLWRFKPESLLPVAGLFLIALAVIVVARPRYAVYGAVILAPYYFILHDVLTSGELGFSTKVSPVDVLAALGALGMLLRVMFAPRNYRIASLDSLVLLWLALALFALAHGVVNGWEAAFRASRGPLLWIFYFIAAADLTCEKERNSFARMFRVSALAVGFVGVVGAAGYLARWFEGLAVGSVGETLVRPNFFVEIALTIPNIVFLLALVSIRPRPPLVGRRFLVVFALLLNVAALLLSVTRGFWLGMVAAVPVLAGARLRRRRGITRLVILAAVLVGAFGIVEFVLQRWAGVDVLGEFWSRVAAAIKGYDFQSVNYRLEELKAYGVAAIGSPVVGRGFGVPVELGGGFVVTPGFAHDEYVWVLATTGVLGFAVLGVVMALALAQARRLQRLEVSPLTRCLADTLAATIVGFAVAAITSPEFTNPTTVPLLASLVGVLRGTPAAMPKRQALL